MTFIQCNMNTGVSDLMIMCGKSYSRQSELAIIWYEIDKESWIV